MAFPSAARGVALAMFTTCVLAVLAACMAGSPAIAGPLLITPTTVQFAPERHSAAIEVTNQSPDSVDLQFRAFAWSQVDGRDRLEPAADLAISPPIARVAPHAKQVFRILDTRRAEAGAGGAERSYRLTLDELPRASASAIAINVEFSLPVFLTPAGATARLAGIAGDGSVRLVNRGARRIRLSTLAVLGADGTAHELAEGRSTYLLAGATRRIALPASLRIGAGATLTGTTDIGPIDVPLAVLAAR